MKGGSRTADNGGAPRTGGGRRRHRDGDAFTVALPVDEADAAPDLVADLVALGVRAHLVEPGRITLEERLLGILRTGSAEVGPVAVPPSRP